jgi:hypothetical protein
MAQRPVFSPDDGALVREDLVQFEWHPGFARVQKLRSIEALHSSARDQVALAPLLEVSTKSPERLGVQLSAFNLRIQTAHFDRPISIEAAFQGSKIFRESGQLSHIYKIESGKEIKTLIREIGDQPLTGFRFEGREWGLRPTTAFYDWLYLRALAELNSQDRQISELLRSMRGFTDIEYNPKKSLNCQARSCALFVALESKHDVSELVASPELFVEVLTRHGYGVPPAAEPLF